MLPSAVLQEIRQKPDPALAAVEEACLAGWLEECSHSDPSVVAALPDLGEGEREVIAQAVAQHLPSVVLDDMDARRAARSYGLEPIGTVGLLLAAKKQGLLLSLKPELQRLKDLGFWISQSLQDQALQEASEL